MKLSVFLAVSSNSRLIRSFMGFFFINNPFLSMVYVLF